MPWDDMPYGQSLGSLRGIMYQQPPSRFSYGMQVLLWNGLRATKPAGLGLICVWQTGVASGFTEAPILTLNRVDFSFWCIFLAWQKMQSQCRYCSCRQYLGVSAQRTSHAVGDVLTFKQAAVPGAEIVRHKHLKPACAAKWQCVY